MIDDNGCGMGSALLASLQRGESATTKGDGRGTGLAAARRVISRYPRGSIAIESPGPGDGCTVALSFEEF